MSLAINVTTSSGIVLAADSRQSYRNLKGMARIGSDNALKLFQLNKRIGCAVTGIAFLAEEEALRNISSFIAEFRRTRKQEIERMNVKEIADEIKEFFDNKYNWRDSLEKAKESVRRDIESRGFELVGDFEEQNGIFRFRVREKDEQEKQGAVGVDKIAILVAGFNHDGTHEAYGVNIPGEVELRRNSKEKGKEYGAFWIGQTDVTSRIILGWDSRMFNLPFIQEGTQKFGEEETRKQLGGLEYQINWGTMTLQDAVDFATLAIQTTEAIQRFSDGIQMNPGDIPGVGGVVDVAVITQDKGFIWIKKKNLSVERKEVDLDTFPKLQD